RSSERAITRSCCLLASVRFATCTSGFCLSASVTASVSVKPTMSDCAQAEARKIGARQRIARILGFEVNSIFRFISKLSLTLFATLFPSRVSGHHCGNRKQAIDIPWFQSLTRRYNARYFVRHRQIASLDTRNVVNAGLARVLDCTAK